MNFAPNCMISIGDSMGSNCVGVVNGKSYQLTKIGNILITDAVGYEANKDDSTLRFVQACKDPYHRDAVGYIGRSCPQDHPEYLYAIRDNRFIMNIVDVDDPSFFSDILIDKTLKFIRESEDDVLVHCNEGKSRGPSIALLSLAQSGTITGTVAEIFKKFEGFYPKYSPRNGIYQYTRNRINKMVNGNG